MNIAALIRTSGRRLLVAAVSVLSFASCDNAIYDNEGDCSVYYRVKFRYDRNLKWADAFANEVKSVHLYAFDTAGVLAWQKAEKGAALASGDYTMTLDVPAGDYHLIAWCGLDNDGAREESFTVPEMTVGRSRQEELICRLNRKRDEANAAYSDQQLYSLFHGSLDVNFPENEDGGEYIDTIYLTKNTNHVRVILQHLSGEDVDVSAFTFRIEDENGLMASNNDLLPDENITYHAWDTLSGEAGVGKEDLPAGRAIIAVKGAIADLTVGRMMADRREQMMLVITNRADQKVVARVPVIDYALLAKEYYEKAYGHVMTNQEFLDREDEYVLTFFLDEKNEWLASSILIHSWCVVLNKVDLQYVIHG